MEAVVTLNEGITIDSILDEISVAILKDDL